MKKNVLVYRVVAQSRDDETINLLFKNIDLIIQNEEVVFNSPGFYSIKISGVCVEGLYVGRFQIRLGDMIKLWKQSHFWKDGGRYYFHAGGSPLSGVCFKSYWDSNTKKIVLSERTNGMSDMFKSVVAVSDERFTKPDADAYKRVCALISHILKQKTK